MSNEPDRPQVQTRESFGKSFTGPDETRSFTGTGDGPVDLPPELPFSVPMPGLQPATPPSAEQTSPTTTPEPPAPTTE